MRLRGQRQILAGILCAAASATQAETAGEGQGSCEVISNRDFVVVMVCDPAASREQWITAATLACGFKARCNAWIWDDQAKAPDNAPALDSEIPKTNAGAAVAVWINDSRSLMTIKKPE